MVTWRMEDMNDNQKRRVATAINNEVPSRHPQSEYNEQTPLGREGTHPSGLVNISGKVFVRITRRYGGKSRIYDDDNFSGGCKELRDAIAAFLGLKGDSKKDGVEWEYAQKRAEVTETIIEIYSK